MKKFLIGLFVIFAVYACNNDKNDFNKHESGLEYKIITKGTGSKAKIGDVLILNLSYETEDGKVLFNSENTDRDYLRKLEAPKHKGGSFEDGLAMLSVGDSAIFRINAESFLKFTESFSNMPDGVDVDDNVIVKVKLLEILPQEQFDDHIGQKYHESQKIEMEILEKFLNNASIDVEPTESGLYYIEQEKGNGKLPKAGDQLSIHYTVKLIDGQVLETTLGRNPFTFEYGNTNLIAAWDEGLSLMSEGSKAMFICPSEIAYGAEGTKDIPPYSTLIFEVELISIK